MEHKTICYNMNLDFHAFITIALKMCCFLFIFYSPCNQFIEGIFKICIVYKSMNFPEIQYNMITFKLQFELDTSWVTAVTPTDRPKSVHNRCVIKVFGGVFFMLPRCFLDFSVGVGAFVT